MGEENTNETNRTIPEEDGGTAVSKKRIMIIAGTALVVIAAFLSFFFIKTTLNRAIFILSNQEITDYDDGDSAESFSPGDRVYYSLKNPHGSLNADVFILEIERKSEGAFRAYKKITYEIDRTFPKISAYIPGEYFTQSGEYRIRAYLDGNAVADGELVIR
jgi:hypothetical protein